MSVLITLTLREPPAEMAAAAIAIVRRHLAAGTSPREDLVQLLDRTFIWGGLLGRRIERLDGALFEDLAELVEEIITEALEDARP